MFAARRTATLLLALALSGSLGACGDDDASDVSAASSTSTAPATDTTPTTSGGTTTEPTADTSAPASTTPPTTEPVTPPVSCDEGETISADADGDGAADTIVLVTDPSTYTSELRVCTTTATLTLDALGASTLSAADADGDGAAEIFYGGTGATSQTVQVARVVDGSLVTVTANGGPLMLTDGYPDGTPPDGPRHAFGCGGTVDGAAAHLIVLRVTPINASEYAFSLEATGYVLEGGTASVAGTQTVTSAAGTPGGTPEDLIAYANEIVAEHAPAC